MCPAAGRTPSHRHVRSRPDAATSPSQPTQTLPSRSSGTRVDASVVLLPVSVSLDLTRLDPERGLGVETRAQLIGILRLIKSESPIVRRLTYRRGGEAQAGHGRAGPETPPPSLTTPPPRGGTSTPT